MSVMAIDRNRPERDLGGSVPVWAGATLFLAALTIVIDLIIGSDFIGVDFPSFYSACRAAQLHVNFYDVDRLAEVASWEGISHPLPYVYPPVLAYLFMPLVWLKPVAAHRLWGLATVLALCAATLTATLGVRAARNAAVQSDPLPWPLAILFAMCLALALNFRNVVVVGQTNLFVLAAMLPALMGRNRDRHLAACGLALAILIKTTPALFLLICVAQGRWRLVRRTGVWIAVFIALTLVLGAGRAWLAYFQLLPRLAPGETIPGLFPPGAVFNFSLAGFYGRFTEDPVWLRRLATVSAVALTVPLLRVAWLSRGGPRDGDPGLMLAACALMIAAAPLAYIHHSIFLFPGLFMWLAAGRTEPRASTAVAMALGLAVATDFSVIYSSQHLSPGLSRWLFSMNLYALLALYGLGLAQAVGAIRRPAPPIEG